MEISVPCSFLQTLVAMTLYLGFLASRHRGLHCNRILRTMLNSLQEAQKLLHELKGNVGQVVGEWTSFKEGCIHEHDKRPCFDRSIVVVKKAALANLQAEVSHLKANLPLILNYDLPKTFASQQHLEKELDVSHRKTAEAKEESLHWRSRHDAARTEYETERKEKLALKAELAEIGKRVAMQSEYCASMGAVCCTLLWKASQHEQAIPALLVGSHMQSFLLVVCSTLESFLVTYQEEEMPSEQSEELQFVMALCGTVTNIAASTYGRDYLASHSACKKLIQTFVSLLRAPPAKALSKLKNLLLMALYNLTINQTGLEIVTKTKGMVALLIWLLQVEKSSDLRQHALLLLQSLLTENPSQMLLKEITDSLKPELLESLMEDACMDVRKVTEEIRKILGSLKKHEP